MAPDSNRVQAWRSHQDRRVVRKIDFLLADELQNWGYAPASPRSPGLGERCLWTAEHLPFSRRLYPVSRKLFRSATGVGDRRRTPKKVAAGALER